ncbi:hypothetical protein L6164_024352 [Bauhinia variegata]|uniref:Uncharacterized protein n=1 Tax=Bauhinia variegata TaxID=167791 RepID=A0ACB9LZJ3_BAUVA|nr:hypothetical protein L6164_024352 [Bauhinia variegata]
MGAQEQCSVLEDCLKLLKGERGEQRLSGLLLVTKSWTITPPSVGFTTLLHFAFSIYYGALLMKAHSHG